MSHLTRTWSRRFVVLLLSSSLAACAPLLDMAKRPFGEPPSPVTVTTVDLNVRKGPGMSHGIIAVVPRGEAVDVRGEQRGWRRVAIERRGKIREGWVAAKYLKTERPPPPPEPKAVVRSTAPEPKAVVRPKPPEPKPAVIARAPVAPIRPRVPEGRHLRTEPGGEVPIRLPDPPRSLAVARPKQPIEPLTPPSRPAPPRPEPVKEPARPAVPSAGPSRIEPGTYAEEIRPLRDAFAEKRFADAEARLAVLQTNARRSRGVATPQTKLLARLERASVDLDRGRIENGIRRLEEVRDLAAAAEEASVDDSEEPGGFFFGGNGDEAAAPPPYRPNAFERTWIGNSLALGHLLNGDLRTDDVALAEVDRQEDLERAAEEDVRKLEESLRSERDRLGEADADAVQEIVEREYAASGMRAEAVPSAFQSPFAHYVAAVAQELLARSDPARREDALASYAKALDLAPANDLFRAAVDDLSAPDPSPDDRLVHVLIADGFVPEKKALAYELAMPGRTVRVRLPVLTAVPSTVGGASLVVDGTRTEMPLATVADVEAMAMRYERDRTPERAIAVLGVVPEPPRTASIGGLADWIGGGSGAGAAASSATPTPDTASWMMLPARYYAARLRLSKAPHKLRINLLDSDGKPLDAVEVTLDPNAHSLIYVRSAGRILTTRARSPDWFAAETAPASRSP